MNNWESDFREALSAAGIGLPPGERIIVDDAVHRFKGGDDKEPDAWYALHLIPSNTGGDALIAGAYGHWAKLPPVSWCSRQRNSISKEEAQAANQAWRDISARRAEDEKRQHEAAAQKCKSWFAKFPKAEGHMYLALKGIPACGPLYEFTDEMYQGWLALPLQDINGVIRSAQFIADDGTKRFCYGGEVKGCFYPISEVPGGPIIICEGYATGASLFLATGWTVICAMNCGNLLSVTQSIRKEYPHRTLIIAADNDAFTDGNPGLTKAREVTKKVGGCYMALPDFPDSVESRVTDFNDLHQLSGLPEVRRQIYDAMPVVARPIGDFQVPEKDDPSELLKYRYLCERGSLLLTGPAGMGKSSLLVQAAALWANYVAFFGITPRKPLKTVIIQAENDDGDIAEMRDGICRGLGFNEEQRLAFFENVLVYGSWGLTGRAFCQEVVRPLLDLHAPHLCAIDPALSFIGGDVKEQKIVGQFLREYLNPIIFEHSACCVMMHHTNKPATGREKPDWRNGELAYTGSGSAEWANWPRAVLSLQSTGVPGLYNLNASKRGARLAWTDANDQLIYSKLIAWSKDKSVIYWREPSPQEIPDDMLEEKKVGGRKQKWTSDQVAKALEWEGKPSVTNSEFKDLLKRRLGIPGGSFDRVLLRAIEDGRIFQSEINGRYQLLSKPTPESRE